jgi:hypothetical protein
MGRGRLLRAGRAIPPAIGLGIEVVDTVVFVVVTGVEPEETIVTVVVVVVVATTGGVIESSVLLIAGGTLKEFRELIDVITEPVGMAEPPLPRPRVPVPRMGSVPREGAGARGLVEELGGGGSGGRPEEAEEITEVVEDDDEGDEEVAETELGEEIEGGITEIGEAGEMAGEDTTEEGAEDVAVGEGNAEPVEEGGNRPRTAPLLAVPPRVDGNGEVGAEDAPLPLDAGG